MRLPYEHPGTPDLRSPLSFLGWVGRGQWRTLTVATFFGVVWMVTQALFPAAMSRAIDQGIVEGQADQLLLWCGVLVGLGVVSALAGAWRHWFAVTNWLRAAFRSIQLVGWHSADVGEALTRQTPTGDVVAVVASDAMRLGGLYDVFARIAGAVVSYVVVAVILLNASTHPRSRRPHRRAGARRPPRLHRPAAPEAPARTSARSPAGSSASVPTPSPGCGSCAASAASRPSCAGMRVSRSRSARSGTGWPASRRPSTPPRSCCPASSSSW